MKHVKMLEFFYKPSVCRPRFTATAKCWEDNSSIDLNLGGWL